LPGKWQMMAGRLIFPVRDEEGRLVGYAGRLMEQGRADAPRYLNTPGLPRGEILYGLHRARHTIRQEGILYLVEGFKDVIAMHAAGLTGTVGLCGTQLAAGQQALLSRYAARVILVMDGDPAGQAAAVKIASQLAVADIETITVDLPAGSDPDELFRQWGGEQLARFIRSRSSPSYAAQSLLAEALKRWPVVGNTSGREVTPWFSLIPDLLREEDLAFEPEDEEQSPLPQAACEPELIRRLKQIQQNNPFTEECAVGVLLSELFYTYCEIRLIGCIETLLRKLAADSSGNNRNDLLLDLARRRRQLTTISGLLHRAGAV